MKEILKNELEMMKGNGDYQRALNDYLDLKEEFNIIIKKDIESLNPDQFKYFIKKINEVRGGAIQYKKALKDFNNTKKQLKILFDESIPIETRLNTVVTSEGGIEGFQKTGPTILLHFFKSEEYGIWNSNIQTELENNDFFPKVKTSKTAPRYIPLNEKLIALSKELNVNLWILDLLMIRCKDQLDQ